MVVLSTFYGNSVEIHNIKKILFENSVHFSQNFKIPLLKNIVNSLNGHSCVTFVCFCEVYIRVVFQEVSVILEIWITCFWNQFKEFGFWFEKFLKQFTNFNFASFRSFSLILWIFDSKSDIICFVGMFFGEKGMLKFLPRLTVLTTSVGMCMSVRLVNHESVRL